MDGLIAGVLAAILVTVVQSAAYSVPTPTFQIVSPQGLQISIPHSSGISLVAFHYSVNKQIRHVSPGEHNYDVRIRTNGAWVHKNPRIKVRPGDTVHYWIYVLKNGRGHQITGRSWKAAVQGTVFNPKHYTVGRVGCYIDGTARHLTGVYLRNDVMTPMLCIDRCKNLGYAYAGVEDHAECMCGHTMGTYGKAPDSDCYRQCNGDGRYTCGGSWRVEVFQTGYTKPTPATTSKVTTARTIPTLKATTQNVKSTPRVGKPLVGCPSSAPGLTSWNPGNNEYNRITIRSGQSFRLESSATVYSITIQNGGKLVFDDQPGKEIKLRARHIKINSGGEFHIGSETCRYRGKAIVSLYGRANEGSDDAIFGKKFIGVMPGAVLEMHGQEKMAWTLLSKSIPAGTTNPVIDVVDDMRSWNVGDRVLLASTDHDMEQAEELTVRSCSGCRNNQVALQGNVKYLHYGEISEGVDMRGEVGMLTHNIRVQGEMQSHCYNYEKFDLCQFFNYDTFGGHIMILKGFKSVHFEGVEITKMGQQTLARYPIHFHLCDEVKGTYVKSSSIHHVFNRCITIHRTNYLLVKDTVGYDTLGHCYFLEDGGERFNTLDHNLGAVTRHGTVLPTDRNNDMCVKIRHNVWPGYQPHTGNCGNALSTFWMAHPDNFLINNAAAGASGVGIWYIMHGKLSGPSTGLLPDGHSGRSAIGRFFNNRAHSNTGNGIMIDFGIKDSEPSARFPQERFSFSGGLYAPHVDSDTSKPRDPAILEKFICYKNSAGGWMRGGDIFVKNSQFADNNIALTLSSSGSLPFDYGSHQEVTNTVFVGESGNRGTRSPSNLWWGKGYDGIERSFGAPSFYDIKGFEIYDGPIKIEGCSFRKFINSGRGKSSAIKFKSSPFMFTPESYLSRNNYDAESKASLISAPKGDADGDSTSVVHDVDGSTTGYRDSYVARKDNYLYRHPGCVEKPVWNAAICGGSRAINLYVNSDYVKIKATMIRDEYPDKGLQLNGLQHGPEQQHQFGLLSRKTYTLHWNQRSPGHVWLNPYFADSGDWLRVGVCYPSGTTFNEVYYAARSPFTNIESRKKPLRRVYSIQEVDNGAGNDVYFWDAGARLLFVKVKATASRTGWEHCSTIGCERVHIRANVGGGSGDCKASSYGKYRRNPTPFNLARVI